MLQDDTREKKSARMGLCSVFWDVNRLSLPHRRDNSRHPFFSMLIGKNVFCERRRRKLGFKTMQKNTNLRLLTERAALGQTSLTTGRLREDLSARAANNNSLGVREDGGDGEATRALDVHEERVGVLHKSLELVAASLLLGGGVKKVDSQSLSRWSASREWEQRQYLVANTMMGAALRLAKQQGGY